MSKTKEIYKSHSRKETIKTPEGGFSSVEHSFGKTVELEEQDVEYLEVQKLEKEVKKVIDKEFETQEL